MFDIGFAELVIVAILGLIILGPERLPVAIKTCGLWLGRFKQQYRNIRTEVEREIGADEIRQQLHNEEIMQSLKKNQHDLEQFAENTEQSMTQKPNHHDK